VGSGSEPAAIPQASVAHSIVPDPCVPAKTADVRLGSRFVSAAVSEAANSDPELPNPYVPTKAANGIDRVPVYLAAFATLSAANSPGVPPDSTHESSSAHVVSTRVTSGSVE
jgi:hypothetical protein